MVDRGVNVLEREPFAEATERRGNYPGTTSHPVGISVAVGTEENRRVPAHRRPETDQPTLGCPTVQVRNAGDATIHS